MLVLRYLLPSRGKEMEGRVKKAVGLDTRSMSFAPAVYLQLIPDRPFTSFTSMITSAVVCTQVVYEISLKKKLPFWILISLKLHKDQAQ